jgi:hypothetical protein
MKKVIILLAFIAGFSSVNSTPSLTPSSKATLPLRADEVYLPVGKTGNFISLMDLSHISVKDFETLSGQKLKFSEKVNFKIGQHELKKSINYDGTFNKKNVEKYLTNPKARALGGTFNLVGLLLGLFLSLIGVLIAYLITGDDKKGRVTWAWIGAAISLIVWGALLI